MTMIEKNNIISFTMLPNEIIDNPEIDVYMQSVLLVLYRFRNQESNTCFPSYEVIAQHAKCSVRPAIRTIKRLEEMGIISVCRHEKNAQNAHASNVYTLQSLEKCSISIDTHDRKH